MQIGGSVGNFLIFSRKTFDSVQLVHFTSILYQRMCSNDISFITVSTAEVTVMIPRWDTPKLIQSASLLHLSLARISLSVVSNGQLVVAPLLSNWVVCWPHISWTTFLLLIHDWFYQHHQALSIMERAEFASLIRLRAYKLDEIELKLTILHVSRVSNILPWEGKWILRLCATTHKGTERPISIQLQLQMSDWTRDWQPKKLLRR
jgi:hypothetical protein